MIIMKLLQLKIRYFHISTVIIALLECRLCRQVHIDGVTKLDFGGSEAKTQGVGSLHSDRNGKQFFLPVVVWPFSVGIELQNNGKSQLPPFLSLEPMLSLTPDLTRDGKFSQSEETVLSHAKDGDESVFTVPVPCKTQDNELGICEPFTKCFPMMEMQYGSANYIDYMDVPLAEQLILQTNDSVCSQSENVEDNLKVCCRSTHTDSNPLLHKKGKNYEQKDTISVPMITQRPPLRNSLSRRLLHEQKCGKSLSNGGLRPQGKVTGGQEARGPNEFPWMVAVFGKNKKIFCGATLISDQFLLSAAHCFSTFKPNDIPHLYVHLGDFNLKTTADGPHEVRKIEKIIIHKGFRIDNYHNDISLLKLDKPVNFTDRISPICLPQATMDPLDGREIIVTGWGRKYRYGTTSDVLRKVEMPVWNLQECKRLYSRFAPGRVLDTNICAGDGKRNKDACLGDSGGPAQIFDGEKFVLVGITSWGKGCGSFPGVYTDTRRFLMWIAKNLNQFS